jgi:hypothetical protein
VTVFLGGGFAAKYLHGGGNFSVPLQWMLGLRRLKLDAFWLEHLPSEGNTRDDERKIDNSDDNCARTDSAAGIVCFITKHRTACTISTRFAVSECRNANCSIDSPARTSKAQRLLGRIILSQRRKLRRKSRIICKLALAFILSLLSGLGRSKPDAYEN